MICAIFIPEITIENIVLMEPISGIENILKQRWKLRCYLCRQRKGCCIQCSHKTCCTSFHITCAKYAGFERIMKYLNNEGFYDMKAYCHRHSRNETEIDIVEKQKQIRKLFDKRSKYKLKDTQKKYCHHQKRRSTKRGRKQ